MTIYVSSIALGVRPMSEILHIAEQNSFAVEFSANFNPNEDLIGLYESANVPRLPHNYFPPPRDPFVLNLASQDHENRKRSIDHCLKGLELSCSSGGNYYSAHAGFCFDPKPSELGAKIMQAKKINRDKNWEIFLESCTILQSRARELGITFLIENNVLAPFNLREDGIVPLLCTEPSEIENLMNTLGNDHFGILLDTAHLKVSSVTLDFSLMDAVSAISKYVKYIHHSDNDGTVDSNELLTLDYWFLPCIKDFKTAVHVIEVKNIDVGEIQAQIKLIQNQL